MAVNFARIAQELLDEKRVWVKNHLNGHDFIRGTISPKYSISPLVAKLPGVPWPEHQEVIEEALVLAYLDKESVTDTNKELIREVLEELDKLRQ